jgi:hypothetical protein
VGCAKVQTKYDKSNGIITQGPKKRIQYHMFSSDQGDIKINESASAADVSELEAAREVHDTLGSYRFLIFRSRSTLIFPPYIFSSGVP